MKLSFRSQIIEEADVRAVLETLRSDYLTTGPKVAEFETAFADFVRARHAVAVANGTAALHAAMFALGLGPGDEVIVPAITFAATANAVVYQGAMPVFADVTDEALLLDPDDVRRRLTPRTRAIVAVDFAGQACDYDALAAIAQQHNLSLVADACHAIGGSYKGRPVGSLARLNTFSFHPVKNMTTGEGGMVTTDNAELAQKMKVFRNHGITTDHHQREANHAWSYEMVSLGYNYRMTDFQCALGLTQLQRLPEWIEQRQARACLYDQFLAECESARPLAMDSQVEHAFHLYVIKLALDRLDVDRDMIYSEIRQQGIGVNVHYIPVYLHPFYRERFGLKPGLCPAAEAAFAQIMSLPIHPNLSDGEVEQIVATLMRILERHQTA